MNDIQLQRLVSDLSKQFFQKSFKDQAVFNSRLRTTGGRYLPDKRTIEINPKYLAELGMDEMVGIIKHELCHYHLHITGKPFGHGDKAFKTLLKETNSPRHCQPLPSEVDKLSLVYKYKCQSCGQLYKRRRKVNINRYSCGHCKGKISPVN
ncbi:SprT family protein [Amphibacillus sp. MSJ-3]|uniref:SprT family protein n=1 Tax=Amphibacillus sp. MSJ-3 TaxID=2841505 RepID=UPI001C0F2ED6|nr:SprT family protein [Amphibacillus sp. MSJ-3]MBU5595718.1 SprT family protein [Amphibacillus sp. MSJ-3]